MLIDVHAHFFPEHSARADWREYNASRLRAGERIGITVHLNSVLGTFGRTSPTYFPSPADVTYGNDWPGKEASDAAELCHLAARHPTVHFILAHIGGGGDWLHSLAVLPRHWNVLVDLSGSGVDGGMLEACLEAVGVERLLWGTDVTMETGWAKLRYLERLLPAEQLELVRWKNAARIFPRGAFPAD